MGGREEAGTAKKKKKDKNYRAQKEISAHKELWYVRDVVYRLVGERKEC